MTTSKTIPVSPEIHRLIRHVAINYDVKIQEAAARIILAGAKALQLDLPKSKVTLDDPFWRVAETSSAEIQAARKNKTEPKAHQQKEPNKQTKSKNKKKPQNGPNNEPQSAGPVDTPASASPIEPPNLGMP